MGREFESHPDHKVNIEMLLWSFGRHGVCAGLKIRLTRFESSRLRKNHSVVNVGSNPAWSVRFNDDEPGLGNQCSLFKIGKVGY